MWLAAREILIEGWFGHKFDRQDNTEGEIEYKVRWEGYGESHDSWEPADGIADCEALDEWLANEPDQNQT